MTSDSIGNISSEITLLWIGDESKLKDVTIRNAKAKQTPYKLSDGRGLYLHVTPAGGRLWRWDYRHDGKRKTVKGIQDRGARHIAKRALETTGQIFRFAVAHVSAERNPAAEIRPADVLQKAFKTNYARIDAKELPHLAELGVRHGVLLLQALLQIFQCEIRQHEETIPHCGVRDRPLAGPVFLYVSRLKPLPQDESVHGDMGNHSWLMLSKEPGIAFQTPVDDSRSKNVFRHAVLSAQRRF